MKKKQKNFIKKSESNPGEISFEKCYELINKNSYQKAFVALNSKLSEPNATIDPRACYELSLLYENGNGTQQDLTKAFEWLQKAIDYNYPEAEYKYAINKAPYIGNNGFDYQSLIRWLERASSHNHAYATLELARLYFKGTGIDKDENKAIELIKKAHSIDNSIDLDEEIGQCYYTSLQLEKAFPYLKNAFNNGRYGVSGILSIYYMRGLAGVEENLDIGYGILKRGAKFNDGLSEYIIGCCYRDNSSIELSIEYFKKAHLHGISEAAYELANEIMRNPLRKNGDEKQAIKLLQKAANLNVGKHIEATADLGTCYYAGWGVSQDYEKAIQYFQKALEQNPKQDVALYGLGNCYLNGFGCTKDENKGLELIQQAAENGAKMALLDLTKFYKEGIHVEKNHDLYINYLTKSAEANDDLSLQELGNYYHECNKNILEDVYPLLKKSFELGNIDVAKNIISILDEVTEKPKDVNDFYQFLTETLTFYSIPKTKKLEFYISNTSEDEELHNFAIQYNNYLLEVIIERLNNELPIILDNIKCIDELLLDKNNPLNFDVLEETKELDQLS